MKKTNTLFFILSVFAGIFLAACSGNFSSASILGEWELVAYGDASDPRPALADIDTAVSFGIDGEFGGNVGCNSFGTDYKIEGESIQFGSFFSTMMFCDPSSAQENDVLAILSDQTLTYSVDSDRLTLTSVDGLSVVIFEKK